MTMPTDPSREPAYIPPINAYAVISLVAALVGLFPVAIVFAILAFWRPGGRGVAIAGLIIGLLELAAVLAIVSGVGNALQDDPIDFTSAATTTLSAPTTAPDPTTTPDAPLPPSESSTIPSPTTDEYLATEVPAESVTLGEYCASRGESMPAADGSTAYCSRLAGTDAYVWSGNPTVASNPDLQQTLDNSTGGSARAGEPCYDETAQADGDQGTTLYCNATVNGRLAGNLVWQLQP
jgi:hypothetical protein